MNPIPRLLLVLMMFLSGLTARAQDTTTTTTAATDASATDTQTAPAGSTVITADELRSDQATHISVFTGNVVVVGTNFNLTCEEMTVNFTTDGKVDVITAKGNVVITQPNRITHSGQAQYFREEDKFVLTDSPNIVDSNNRVEAPIITIFRTKQTMITSGGKSTVTLKNSSIGSSTTNPAPNSTGTP